MGRLLTIPQVIQAARRLYRVPGQHLTLGQVVELSKRMMEGYLTYKDEPKIIDLRQKVIAYNRLLRDMGIADHQVERASSRSIKSLLLLVYRVGLLLWWSILALPGALLHAPVFILAKLISIQKAKGTLSFLFFSLLCLLTDIIPNYQRHLLRLPSKYKVEMFSPHGRSWFLLLSRPCFTSSIPFWLLS